MLDTSASAPHLPSCVRDDPPPLSRASDPAVPLLADDAQMWISTLRGPAGPRDQALAELHALLLLSLIHI